MTVESVSTEAGAAAIDESSASRAPGAPCVIVALHDGFYGTSSGTGFSNRAFLSALSQLLPPGQLVVLPAHVPEGNPHWDHRWNARMRKALHAAGARVVPIPHGHALTDSVRGCETLCQLVAEETAQVAAKSGRCLLIGLDVPFLGLAPHVPDDMDLLLVPRSTAVLAHPEDRARIRWERAGLRSAAAKGSRIAAISQHMRRHLRQDYGVPTRALLDLTNGLLLEEETTQPSALLPLPAPASAGFLLAMGRAVPEKGFEDLVIALSLLRSQRIRIPHLVLAATNTAPRADAYQALLARIIREYRVDATLITRFTPAVRGWLHSPALRAVIVPSREEPFGRIPLEAFAAKAGPWSPPVLGDWPRPCWMG